MEIWSQCSLCMLSVQTVAMEIEIDSVFTIQTVEFSIIYTVSYSPQPHMHPPVAYMKCLKPVNLA